MAIRLFQPREELREFVGRIYAHESRQSEIVDPRWLIVPDGEIKVIFPFRGDILCTIGDTERLHPVSRLIVSGMRTVPGYLGFPNVVGAIGVVLKPEAAHRFLDVPCTRSPTEPSRGRSLSRATTRRIRRRLAVFQ